MHLLTTNKSAQTYDVHSFGFESAGALEIGWPWGEYAGYASYTQRKQNPTSLVVTI